MGMVLWDEKKRKTSRYDTQIHAVVCPSLIDRTLAYDSLKAEGRAAKRSRDANVIFDIMAFSVVAIAPISLKPNTRK
jgi:hypothetical protein